MFEQSIRVEHHTLVSVDEDHHTVAQTKGGRHFIGEVHMPGSVEDVQEEILLLQVRQENGERSGLDRNTAFLLGEESVRVSQLGEKCRVMSMGRR